MRSLLLVAFLAVLFAVVLAQNNVYGPFPKIGSVNNARLPEAPSLPPADFPSISYSSAFELTPNALVALLLGLIVAFF